MTNALTFERIIEAYDAQRSRYIAEWMELLRFESISTDASYHATCRACAAWLVQHLSGIGMQATLRETSGLPLVVANYRGGGPRVVFYGHYDVQPVDPLEAWDSAPFDPQIRRDRMYARGAQDNKGQVMYFLKAVELLIQQKALPYDLTIVLEGEEESGSAGLQSELPALARELQADLLLVCDTGTPRAGVAAITMGLRGIVHASFTLHGPTKDLHSGVHGGVVRNPAQEIAHLAASLHNPDGTIAVAGYYDGVEEPSADLRQAINGFPLTAAQYEALIGAPPNGGEQRFSMWERRGVRPTIDVNGIHGGYGGPGGKTVIPASAVLKLSSRLVPGQDPQRCLDLLCAHLRERVPDGMRLEIEDASVGGPALALDPHSPTVQRAREVLQQVCGDALVLMWEGASIPIVAGLAKALGAEPLLVGFGLEEDNIHAPNESFALDQFRQGFLYSALLLSRPS